MGLKACVVYPARIFGSNDRAISETTGTIAAIDKERIGECCILDNKIVTLKEMCDMLHKDCNAKHIRFYLTLDLADKSL